jgi:hypothetical protein
VLPIANYSGRPIDSVTVTLRTANPFATVVAARASAVHVERQGETVSVTLPLGWADMIVLRR